MREVLTLAFFYYRLVEKMKTPGLSGLDYDELFYSRNACYDKIAVDVHKLLEDKTRNWGFPQLLRLWKPLEADSEKHRSVQKALDRLSQLVSSEVEYRNRKIAHQSKTLSAAVTSLTDSKYVVELTFPATKIDYLQQIVDIMDMFVSSPIPYTLRPQDGSNEFDLRTLLGLERGTG